MEPLRLYRFRYSDARTGRWAKARYRAEAIVIRMRQPEHELRDVERRQVRDDRLGYLNPHQEPGSRG